MMKDLSDPETVKLTPSLIIEASNLELSSLHADLRNLNSYYIWHINGRLQLGWWKKKILLIQEMFWDEQGLIVDMPTPGFGSLNTGKTAWRFLAATLLWMLRLAQRSFTSYASCSWINIFGTALTKNQYIIIKRYVGHPFPNYNMILDEKKKRPPRQQRYPQNIICRIL